MRLVLSNLTVSFFVIYKFVCIIKALSLDDCWLFKVLEKVQESTLTIEVCQRMLVARIGPFQGMLNNFLLFLDMRFLLLEGSKQLIRLANNIVCFSSVDVALVAAVVEALGLLNIRYNLMMFIL